MSDFNSSFWSVFIATVTLLGIVACLVLLWVTAKFLRTALFASLKSKLATAFFSASTLALK